MSRPTQFRLRWKGAVTGPFPLLRVSEMLRAGEISLLHNIEVDGSWMTVRDYFRAIGLTRAPSASAAENSGVGGETPPPPPGAEHPLGEALTPDAARNAAGESLERTVREGYLWCGSTFLFPPLFAVVVPLWEKTSGSPLALSSKYTLFIFATLLGCSLPLWLVQRVGRQISQEGVSEIAQAQSRLCLVLAGLGAVFWLFMFWFLANGRV